MAFKKGDPKPPNSGRQKGVPNRTSLRLLESLKDHDCDFAKELAGAILRKDADMVEALAKVLPFLAPKLKEQAVFGDAPSGPVPHPSKLPHDMIPHLLALASSDSSPKT